ncbi:MAG: lipoprotein [Steroidobacteraceae bacterium]
MKAARAITLSAALLALTGGAAGGLSGCGLKGSLYLPQQKKTKVPETVNNPAADAPPPAPAGSTAPDGTAPGSATPQQSAPAPNPTPTVPEPGSSSPTGPAPRG